MDEDRSVAELLATGDAFADLSFWRKLSVAGSDGPDWLNDLISADISDLGPGQARRSLLLSPTGRIRAEFTVAALQGELLLLQDPMQPAFVGDLLSRYVLSSQVVLADRTEDLALFAFPGRPKGLPAPGGSPSEPSCLGGGDGHDLIGPAKDRGVREDALEELHVRAGNEDVEAWRVRAGIPRFGVDAMEGDLPQEGAMDDLVAFDKGCYLGQEAVAKVRNLGHPRRLLLALAADQPVSPGDPVVGDGLELGEVTSVAPQGDAVSLLARVRWEGRDLSLRTELGVQLRRR